MGSNNFNGVSRLRKNSNQINWNLCIYVKSFVNVMKTITAHFVNVRFCRKEMLHIQLINDYYSH